MSDEDIAVEGEDLEVDDSNDVDAKMEAITLENKGRVLFAEPKIKYIVSHNSGDDAITITH